MQLHYIFPSALRSELCLSLPPRRSEPPQGPGFCSMWLKVQYRKAWPCSDKIPLLDSAGIVWEWSLMVLWYHSVLGLVGDTASNNWQWWAFSYGSDILLWELPSTAHWTETAGVTSQRQVSSSSVVRALDGSCAQSGLKTGGDLTDPTTGQQSHWFLKHGRRTNMKVTFVTQCTVFLGKGLWELPIQTWAASPPCTYCRGNGRQETPRVGIKTVFSFPLSCLLLGPSLVKEKKIRQQKNPAAPGFLHKCSLALQLIHLLATLNSRKYSTLSL